ncbi:MAG: polysaccharide pyruvyl transferase family protein [Candidatus Muirbacterium halophilum]|nr:polysaccharide pyruvyl transferase family protein [Candidatus Muirbacterium halophilum]
MVGNKGGPAMAISIISELKKIIKDVEFVIAVPAGSNYCEEEKKARFYNIKIVKRVLLSDFYFKVLFKNFYVQVKKIFKYFSVYNSADIILNLSGISYVGEPEGKIYDVLGSQRFFNFLQFLIFRKSFFAWSQNYGPLNPNFVRFLAKWDLKHQRLIFCRGIETKRMIVDLMIGQKNILNVPDIAFKLPFGKREGEDYIKNILGCDLKRKIVTISPSFVLYRLTGEDHIRKIQSYIRYLINKSYYVILVPHSYFSQQDKVENCDYLISKSIFESLSEEENIKDFLFLVKEDLDVIMLKSLISNAYIHIGARYHSIVASTSTNVPTICLSWHKKYVDIMYEFKMNEFVIEYDSYDKFVDIFDKLEERHDIYVKNMKKYNAMINKKISRSIKMFIKLYGDKI